jgi:hypothetical protein
MGAGLWPAAAAAAATSLSGRLGFWQVKGRCGEYTLVVFLLEPLPPLLLQLPIKGRNADGHAHHRRERNRENATCHSDLLFRVARGCFRLDGAYDMTKISKSRRRRASAPAVALPGTCPSWCCTARRRVCRAARGTLPATTPRPPRPAPRHADAAKCPNGDRKDSSRTRTKTKRSPSSRAKVHGATPLCQDAPHATMTRRCARKSGTRPQETCKGRSSWSWAGNRAMQRPSRQRRRRDREARSRADHRPGVPQLLH